MDDFRIVREPILVRSHKLDEVKIFREFNKVRESEEFRKLPVQGRVDLESAFYASRDYDDFVQKVRRIMDWYLKKKVG